MQPNKAIPAKSYALSGLIVYLLIAVFGYIYSYFMGGFEQIKPQVLPKVIGISLFFHAAFGLLVGYLYPKIEVYIPIFNKYIKGCAWFVAISLVPYFLVRKGPDLDLAELVISVGYNLIAGALFVWLSEHLPFKPPRKSDIVNDVSNMGFQNIIWKVIVVGAAAGLIYLVWQKTRSAQDTCQPFKVVSVKDGDTLTVALSDASDPLTIRVLGIDCPEIKRNLECTKDEERGWKGCEWQILNGLQAFKETNNQLEDLYICLECPEEYKYVKGEPDSLACYLETPSETDFGLAMIRKGLCRNLDWKSPHPRMEIYSEAEKSAKIRGIGIWSEK
jgi:endonuclease YncB( thermonuclease family)